MNLNDILDGRHILEVICDECRSATPLDPSFFASRYGPNVRLEDIAQGIVCPSCGSADVRLSSKASPSLADA